MLVCSGSPLAIYRDFLAGHFLGDVFQKVLEVANKVTQTVLDKKASQEQQYNILSYNAFPLILHLDPIKTGGHDTHAVSSALKQWLRCVPIFRGCEEA